MSHKFIATILAAALAITGISASSAKASDAEAIVKFLGAATTLYIIGSAINDSRDSDKRKVYVHSKRDRYDQYGRGRHDYGHKGYGKHRRKVLPSTCSLRGWHRNKGRRDVLGARCVEQRYGRTLPNKCRTRMRTEKGVRVVYDTNCLRRQGYTVARR